VRDHRRRRHRAGGRRDHWGGKSDDVKPTGCRIAAGTAARPDFLCQKRPHGSEH
jgi:hypothetical protein